MRTNQWIKDVKTVIGCEVPQLFKVLANIADKEEDSDIGLFARKAQSKILECIEAVKPFLGEIRRNAQDFTLHDIQHCINVIDFMGQMLIDIKSLNPVEISFFIYSALLHDIGMVKLLDEDISLDDLREEHGERSARFIRERRITTNNGKQFDFGEWDEIYMEYLPPICASHMQEFSFVEILPQSYILDGMEVDMSLCAILLRVADAMDLKRNRAPYQLYQFLINRSVSLDHWKKHMSISNCYVNSKGTYRVDGICHEEAAHRCLYNHLDTIESEIEKVFKWMNGPHPRLKLSSHIVERNIKTNKYKMWHHSFSMDILKITNLIMGEQLYGDRKLGIREIIQNSMDACMVRDEINKKLGAKQDYSYHPEIYIIFDRDNKQVIVRDNGIGMNDYIIQNYFLNIGASYYSSNDYKKKKLEYSPSGYFGIGFLSTFMLSDDVYVRTAHWQEDVEYEFHFIKSDKFVTKIERPKTFSGTEIRLNLDQFEEVFTNHSSNKKVYTDNLDSSVKYNLVDFIYNTFWNLRVRQIDNDVILCSIRTDNFLEFIEERFKDKYEYSINIGEYINDVEGVIELSSSELFSKMKCLKNIYEEYPLDAIRKGEVIISNNIRDHFSFIKHFYHYPHSLKMYEIKDKKITNFNSYILFPTKESNMGFDYKYKISLNDYEITELFNLYNWNCMCTNDNYVIIDRQHITFDIYEDFEMLENIGGINTKEIHNYIGYWPKCFIIVSGLEFLLSNMLYMNSMAKFIVNSNEGHFWLKQARINIDNFAYKNVNFNYFYVKNIIMRMTNSLIIPDSSRKFIIDSSANILKNAIFLCVFIWIYDQIKDYKMASKSSQSLKQIILDNWDFTEGLLKTEKKPV